MILHPRTPVKVCSVCCRLHDAKSRCCRIIHLPDWLVAFLAALLLLGFAAVAFIAGWETHWVKEDFIRLHLK